LQEVGAVRTVAVRGGRVEFEQALPGESVRLYELSW
jgi:hypothetical protein